MNRVEFAERISSGLAGWLQQLAAQGLEGQVGEDAARVELVRLISAQRAYVPQTSMRPTNWPTTTGMRVDIAVLGKKAAAAGWYGAIELKWPKEKIDPHITRNNIVQDALRAAFSNTANLNANFLIVGGTASAIKMLFDTEHERGEEREERRKAFNQLLSRDIDSPDGALKNALLNERFPDAGIRVPPTTFAGWSRRLATELVARATATVGAGEKGFVYVWQCKR